MHYVKAEKGVRRHISGKRGGRTAAYGKGALSKLSILTKATMPTEILKFRVGKVAGKLISVLKESTGIGIKRQCQ